MVQNTTSSEVNYPANVPCLKRTWTYTTGNAVESSPVVAERIVYVGSRNHTL
jgi:hypothetical protein